MFTVTSSGSHNQLSPTVNEVVSVLSTAIAEGKIEQHAAMDLRIAGRADTVIVGIIDYAFFIASCADKPCYPDVKCTDVHGGSNRKFQCGVCPEGFTGDGITCIATHVSVK